MKRLIIVCEGPTEQEFCNYVLSPHLASFEIEVSAPVVKKSNGGIVPWYSLRTQILNHLRETGAVVTMLVDYYGIKEHMGFPGWSESLLIPNKTERINFLIEKMRQDVSDDVRFRFLPYIQLHEFEGLLFCDINSFRAIFNDDEAEFAKIESAINEFDTPEDINNSPNTAPSKRLLDAIPGYNKILYGRMLAESIGLDIIRSKCPMFNEWLTKLENI